MILRNFPISKSQSLDYDDHCRVKGRRNKAQMVDEHGSGGTAHAAGARHAKGTGGSSFARAVMPHHPSYDG